MQTIKLFVSSDVSAWTIRTFAPVFINGDGMCRCSKCDHVVLFRLDANFDHAIQVSLLLFPITESQTGLEKKIDARSYARAGIPMLNSSSGLQFKKDRRTSAKTRMPSTSVMSLCGHNG